jgi:hypothetical protein
MDIARSSREGQYSFYNHFESLLQIGTNSEVMAALGPQWKQLGEQADG